MQESLEFLKDDLINSEWCSALSKRMRDAAMAGGLTSNHKYDYARAAHKKTEKFLSTLTGKRN